MLVNDLLVRMAEGKCSRAIISMPPRHGKSELISANLPAWFLGMFPDKRILLSSYEADFAAQWGRRARNLIKEFGGIFPEPVEVDPESTATSRWSILGHKGSMQTAGIGGALTGKGADIAIIDDPIKNSQMAASKTNREMQWDWYKSTMYTRLEPGAGILLVMTRWHEEDLAGKLLHEMEEGGEKWEVLSLPSIAEENDQMGRKPGEALWPSRFGLDKLSMIRRTVGPYWFAGLYQQRPAPLEGGIFKREWFEIIDRLPPGRLNFVRHWDLAATLDGGDWTAGLLLGEQDGYYYIANVDRFQLGPAKTEARVKQNASVDGPTVGIQIEQEPGSSGVITIDHFKRRVLRGYEVREKRSEGTKPERARLVAAAAESGLIKVIRGPWVHEFLAEITTFPNGSHDDQVDCLSGAYNALTLGDFWRGDTATIDDALGEQMKSSRGSGRTREWSGDIPGL